MQPQSLQAWHNAERLFAAREHIAARLAYQKLVVDPQWASLAHLRLSLIASVEGRHRDAVQHAVEAFEARLSDPDLLEMVAKRLLTLGETQAAVDCASSPIVQQTPHPATLAELGKLMSDHDQPQLALRLLEQARHLGLATPAIHYLIGLSQSYIGDTTAAEVELNNSLQADPDFAPAARALCKLKKQTASSNHVHELRASLDRIGKAHGDAPLLHYALFKELDDLDEPDAAWQALSEGMRMRRRQIRHDSSLEAALFDHLHSVNGRKSLHIPAVRGPNPIFIIGMPRSGTTLLERILGAHPDVADAGELRDFVSQLRWMCNRGGGQYLDLDLAQRAENIDWAQLGQRYLMHTQWRAGDHAFYTDKMPANFINAGYIARALPEAKIVHMVRDPMDTCFSNLKELFGAAYPHTYDQVEMADHFLQYQRLMAHWHAQFPNRILDVHYSALVTDPTRIAKQVLDFCGLVWDPTVVAIEARGGTVATASALQVREPIHARFVGQWRKYAQHLQPLRERLGNPAF